MINKLYKLCCFDRYIYKLHDLHKSAENYIEAGFTLKLFADKLSWESHALKFIPLDNNGLVEWQLKENLYQQIIKYFDSGNCWEKGIPLCKELANFYETKLFNYTKLSSILHKEAKFFQNILNCVRPEPEYFRVGFYGRGFPSFVRVS
jgi:dedicator of cytokinesis protein 3